MRGGEDTSAHGPKTWMRREDWEKDMPCTLEGLSPPDTDDQGMEVRDLVRMLCGLCARVDALDPRKVDRMAVIEADPTLANWWFEHKKQDARELAKMVAAVKNAELRRAALAKLTKKEKEILGIRGEESEP